MARGRPAELDDVVVAADPARAPVAFGRDPLLGKPARDQALALCAHRGRLADDVGLSGAGRELEGGQALDQRRDGRDGRAAAMQPFYSIPFVLPRSFM